MFICVSGIGLPAVVVARHTISNELLTKPQISSSESLLRSLWYLSLDRQPPVTLCVILNEALWRDSRRTWGDRFVWSRVSSTWDDENEASELLNVKHGLIYIGVNAIVNMNEQVWIWVLGFMMCVAEMVNLGILYVSYWAIFVPESESIRFRLNNDEKRLFIYQIPYRCPCLLKLAYFMYFFIHFCKDLYHCQFHSDFTVFTRLLQ